MWIRIATSSSSSFPSSVSSLTPLPSPGSVDGLIAEATVYRDVEFVETVIFTHTTFITTEELLEKLTVR